MKLLIVESPSKAKTIEKYLKGEYTVKASVGHVRDLPKSNKDAVNIEKGFKPKYVISPRKKDVISELKKLAIKADEIVLATDPDREGEAIAWHVAEVLGLKDADARVKRITFNEITKEAVQEAMKHPRAIDTNLLSAQEARRVLDRLFGYDLSGLIWKKVRYGLSAGRVQSPALRLIMEREREIRAFNPEDYFVITADVTSKEKEQFILTCSKEPREKSLVDTILDVGKKEPWIIKDIEEKEAKRNPYPPFKTSTLQQAASSRLGFAPSRTMRVAQKLYEAGFITYMRTDSMTLSQQALGQASSVIKDLYGDTYLNTRQYATKSKSAQEAHEAIRPTNLSKQSAGLNDEQKKLYDLIWRRTISSQMKSADILRTKVIAQIGEGSIPDFHINGSRTLFDGWLKADPRAKGEDVELPKLSKGETVDLLTMHVEEKQTQPPARYSEARLIKELEKRGIGRPSTYATIIQTLADRGYVTRDKRVLTPTDTGEVVSQFLEDNFTTYISDSFTADMENELDDIARGDREYEKTLSEFYFPFKKQVEAKEEIPKLTDLGKAPDNMKCPICGNEMVIKLGKTGKFYSCSNFPNCKGALTLEGKTLDDGNKTLGTDPATGETIFLMEGPYGPYVQLGEKTDKKKKPRRASIPKDKKSEEVTLEDALTYLSLPRLLGTHPDTGKNVEANIGRFGPYIAHMTDPKPDYRSLKEDDAYTITFERALEILSEPKKFGRGRKSKK